MQRNLDGGVFKNYAEKATLNRGDAVLPSLPTRQIKCTPSCIFIYLQEKWWERFENISSIFECSVYLEREYTIRFVEQ